MIHPPRLPGSPPPDDLTALLDADGDPATPADLDPDTALDDEGLDDADLTITHAPRPRACRSDPADERLTAWMLAIADHDEQALGALYDTTLPRVYGLVRRIVRRPALADEVVEDTYFQLWRLAPRFDPERGSALGWLLGMARSRAIDALRREARHIGDSLDDEATAAIADDRLPAAEVLLDAARDQAQLHQALMQLNPQPRQLVALAFLKGLSHEEIASQTTLPLGTVKSQIRRALLTLRGLLVDATGSTLAS